MNKKWNLIIICLVLLMTYSINETIKIKVHTDLVSNILMPYSVYKDPSKRLSIIGADDTEDIKQSLIELSDTTGVSFSLSFMDPTQENTGEYYWYFQNEKYLDSKIGFNKDIGLQTFNEFKKPVTNQVKDEYYFELPLSTYNYKIFPFQFYDKSNMSSELTIFAETEQEINEFLYKLESKGLIYVINDSLIDVENSFIDTLRAVIFQNSLTPLVFGLFLIVIFSLLYQDRRNLSIKLVNGYSKIRYILETVKGIFPIIMGTFLGGFLIYYFLSFSLNFKYFIPLFLYFLPIITIIILTSIGLVALIVYSFTDINSNTYVQGIRSKTIAPSIISFAKISIGFLICLSLIPTISQIDYSVSTYRAIKHQENKYSNIYILDSSGNYGATIMKKSDEIVRALKNFDNMIYMKSAFNEDGEEIKHKIFYANDNYLKRHPIFDNDGNLIDSNKTNVVYTKKHNVTDVEMLKQFPTFLCESNSNCFDTETVIIDDDTALTLYTANPLDNDSQTTQDFVLVPKNNNIFLLEYLFIFENEDQISEVRNELQDIVDIEEVNFDKVTNNWTESLVFYRSQIINNIIKLTNFLIIIIILSLIYYQMKFDKVKKDFSIYWVNGISKFNHFYADYFYQILLSGTMILLVKKFIFPALSTFYLLILLLVYICIDTISLTIFRYRFYTQLQKNIKEQV